jgi:hypothetical protein
MPLTASLTTPLLASAPQDEDTINTVAEQTRLKDIPVPISIAQVRVDGTNSFMMPTEQMRSPAPTEQWPKSTGEFADDDRIDWDIDPAGFRFLTLLNKGEKGYAGPPIEEAVFEKIIDRFEKSVPPTLQMPELAVLQGRLAPLVPDASVIDVAYGWWLERRKHLAMPLVRKFRPPPEPEDPDTTGVAFRPREKEGVRKARSNNKKTYNLMASLHDEFSRLKSLCELVKRREKLKLEFHQAAGEYTEAAHRTLLHRLHRQRTGQGGWKDDLEDDGGGVRPPVNHKKGSSAGSSAMAAMGASSSMVGRPMGASSSMAGGARSIDQRSHHKKRLPGPGRPPKDGMPPGPPTAGASRPRDRDRDRDRDRHRRASVPPPPSSYAGLYLRPSDANEVMPSYEDIDSEEEAFNQMVLTVDTRKRDELAAFLPRHLRDVPPPDEAEDAPVPYSDAAGAAAVLDDPYGGDYDSPTGSNVRGWGGVGLFGGLSLGAAAEAAAKAAAAASSSSSSSNLGATPAPAAAPAAASRDFAASYVFQSRACEPPVRRGQPLTVVARLRIGRGGRVLIDRGRGLGGPRYSRPCYHTVVAEPSGGSGSSSSSGGSGSSSSSGGGSSSSTSNGVSAAAGAAGDALPSPAAAQGGVRPVINAPPSGGRGAGSGSGGSGGLGGSSSLPRVTWADGGAVGSEASDGRSVRARPALSSSALSHMLTSGRVCPDHLLEEGMDPDAAWRRNEPVPIKRGPLLFDFSWLPKPQLGPAADGPAVAPPAVGQKRKAAELGADAPSTNGVV